MQQCLIAFCIVKNTFHSFLYCFEQQQQQKSRIVKNYIRFFLKKKEEEKKNSDLKSIEKKIGII